MWTRELTVELERKLASAQLRRSKLAARQCWRQASEGGSRHRQREPLITADFAERKRASLMRAAP